MIGIRSAVRDKCEMPAGWALQFSKCPALCQGEILLDKVPSRYNRNFLLCAFTRLKIALIDNQLCDLKGSELDIIV